MSKNANPEFLYAGNHIVKLWEKYLKSINGDIKFYANDGEVNTLFNRLSQNKEVAIVLNPNNTPYTNHLGQTITLCGEINYTGDSAQNNIEQAIGQIQSYNFFNNKNSIQNHIIIFPYHPSEIHWNLGIITLQLKNSQITHTTINIYEPYGEMRLNGETYIMGILQQSNYFKNTKYFTTNNPNPVDHPSQQNDATSCGAISGENGKEFLKQKADQNNLLEKTYLNSAATKQLREQHIQEIDGNDRDDFSKAQFTVYINDADGDKPIEDQYVIIHKLVELVQQPENNKIKEILPLISPKNGAVNPVHLNTFKTFLIKYDLAHLDEKIGDKILKPNAELKEGGIGLVESLALNISWHNREDGDRSPFSQPPFTATSYSIKVRDLEVNGEVKQQDTKLKEIKKKFEQSEKLSLDDFALSSEITYQYPAPNPKPVSRMLSWDNTKLTLRVVNEFGKSNNCLFGYKDTKGIQQLDFDISKVLDSKENNILHYAAFQHNIDLIVAILNKAKMDGILKIMVNHRNIDGTTPLGMAFLFDNKENLAAIKIAEIFATISEYRINDYLNNKIYMDYSTCNQIGGTTLLHNVILKAKDYNSKESQQVLSDFFKILNKRVVEIEENFNPNYPTMNPSREWKITDSKGNLIGGHMISAGTLLEKLPFNSKKVQVLCQKYFNAILQTYKADQFDDSSGDSEDGSSPAYTYKQMLVDFDSFIQLSLDQHMEETGSGNFQRTFDKFPYTWGIIPNVIWPSVSVEDKYNEERWQSYWQQLNGSTSKMQQPQLDQIRKKYNSHIDSMVTPLFHGVPFMDSQYTNLERREVVRKIFEINRKLLGKYDDSMTEEEYTLTPEEEILIGIHSRTATASVGMQSLYEVMTASPKDLQKLNKVDNILSKYSEHKIKLPNRFPTAMKEYVFNFLTSPIENFWKNIHDGTLPDNSVVKYRFPVIATSKAPDHTVRFAIGNSVEGNRGEIPMQPEYIDGHPTHRLAGLVYVTLHKLSDLVKDLDCHTIIDINRGLKTGEVQPGQGATRFANQLECDFLGKMDSNKVVAVIPIIYPNIRDTEHFEENYHQAIWSISPNAKSNTTTSPIKIKSDLTGSPNPSILNGEDHLFGFGKMIVPSIVSLANGIVTAIANLKNQFLCTIKDNGELIPYAVGFDKKSTSNPKAPEEFSKAQLSLKTDQSPVNIHRVWTYVANQLNLESDVNQVLEGVATVKISGNTSAIEESD